MHNSENKQLSESEFYRKKFLLSCLIPFIFVFLMWLTWLIEQLFNIDLTGFGIHPLSADGLPGIVLSPFIHSGIRHLFNNTLPLFMLSVALFFFYSEVALKVFSFTWLFTGVLVWLAGREAWHIGASGLVYGLASFLFFSGIIRKYYRLVALSMLIVFLYGSMVWGLFPGIYENVSWESHMLGFFAGIAIAIWFRKEGPQEPLYEWMDEEKDRSEEESERGSMGDGEMGRL
jgi:membrane associated rhomboid family serine protease